METKGLTASDIAKDLEEGKFSSRDVTEAYLGVAKGNTESTHAYVDIDEDGALAAADEADRRRSKGKTLSCLDGVPIAIKDNMLVTGRRATAGSNILKEYVAPYDATAVVRVRKAGLVILGKTNMDEYAMGSSTESSCHGVTRNPWDTERVPGGSSGGSAVAVSEGSAPIALGSDTGGSIRQPAALCGTVGFKPTYGRVSRYGLIALASSLDQIGPFARSVRDATDLLRIIEGRDSNDSTSVDLKDDWVLPESIGHDVKGLKIGIPKEYFVSGMEDGVEAAVRSGIERFKELGAEIKEISLPHSDYALATYYIIMPCEASSNLARFDGIRYGTRIPADTLEETYRKSRGAGFGKEARRRIMIGTYALSAGYYDAYYLRAMKVRRLIANDFTKAFVDVDCILSPTAPTVAWRLGEMMDDPLSMYLQDIFTVSVNVAGLPAISVPCGLSDGLPVGLQLIGRHFDDKTVLKAAHAFEQASGGFTEFIPATV
ncbi:MAG: Asp-tRNA(Asn)/Glu-tRNA(Gln) amidotransferase subunit GatA [Patescibacteria group bacterium]|nr:Asp-tRNA(Asn)/Glu-tRNA(Gln) amidotransferase subunit GatA [Patescibacteria group bacterium]